MPKAQKSVSKVTLDLNSPNAVALFRKAAENFTKRATKSRATARQVQVDEGIYTQSGKPGRHYR